MYTLIVDDEPLARNELAYLLERCEGITAIVEAESIEEALEKMLQHEIDLIFLDIHLTSESGLTLANKINQLKNPPMIIFATAYDEYAIKAFELNATDYVLKPFELPRIQDAVQKAYTRYQKERVQLQAEDKQEYLKTIPIQMDERIYIVKIEDIIAIAVENGITTIYTDEKEYTATEPLNAYEEKVKGHAFLRVHRSYLLNMKEILEIQPWFNHTFLVTMSNQVKIPVSRHYMKQFKEEVGL
ncbi:two-component response regulator LytR [Carnobacterium sp. AT7]|jgi:two-component system response regulator LytT|uniref:LytR family transcriptional regulator n=2 Tax=Carnobacterium TaxID=2747 RepID=U5SED3_9LACT|nr:MULTISPECIES: LytTR family transcriptional regulator DNA-binding domain-containing protein [Carnobacterium]AGY82483.1 LytR family transcriptional regulator [Carnobacterium inhibens subsp. gilichinskyi]EDP68788.1 two-component response regulator LytR [Carnobacterium sp. AT7]MDN5372682.1 two-component system, LytTR family, response regulator LytT [Carnobacterium sp.]UDE94624.1 LytTR family transcriptional regulator DNA-binding domain-containing protein [Carnobacterium viridans]SDQ26993.1 two 